MAAEVPRSPRGSVGPPWSRRRNRVAPTPLGHPVVRPAGGPGRVGSPPATAVVAPGTDSAEPGAAAVFAGAEVRRPAEVGVVAAVGRVPGTSRSAVCRGRSALRRPGGYRCVARTGGVVAVEGPPWPDFLRPWAGPDSSRSVGRAPVGFRGTASAAHPLWPERCEFRSDHIPRRPRAAVRSWTVRPAVRPRPARPFRDERRVRAPPRALFRRRRSAGVHPRDPVQPHSATLPA